MSVLQDNPLITLEEFIIQGQNKFPGATGELSQLLRDIGLASKIISWEIRKAGINNILGGNGTQNIHGEHVKKLDIFANEQMINALERSNITCMVISEENSNEVRLKSTRGRYVLFMDPLDGSSNIEVNVSIGSTFSVYVRKSPSSNPPDEADALQSGLHQVAAGYILYGSSTTLVYTTGRAVNMFTLDPSMGEYILSKRNIKIPEKGNIYSINEGSYQGWQNGLKKYIKYCQEVDPDTDRPYTSRYIGSMVADVHRTLLKGGIFIYPKSLLYPSGKLRLMYECNPLAMIIEQAGGMATDGFKRILSIEPAQIHEQSPIFIGSRENVLKAMSLLAE